MTVVSDVLPVLDSVEQVLSDLGFKEFDVLMRQITWTGERFGVGSVSTTVDTPIVNKGSLRVDVKRLSGRDLVASGGRYQEGDYKIGPITPAYTGGGNDPSFFNPAVSALPQEVLFNIQGPGFPPAGLWCEKKDQDTSDPFAYYFILRATGIDP